VVLVLVLVLVLFGGLFALVWLRTVLVVYEQSVVAWRGGGG